MLSLVRSLKAEKKHLQAVVQIVAGLALDAFPAVFIAVFARVAPISLQGFLAVCLAIGAYVAQCSVLTLSSPVSRLRMPTTPFHCLGGWRC